MLLFVAFFWLPKKTQTLQRHADADLVRQRLVCVRHHVKEGHVRPCARGVVVRQVGVQHQLHVLDHLLALLQHLLLPEDLVVACLHRVLHRLLHAGLLLADQPQLVLLRLLQRQAHVLHLPQQRLHLPRLPSGPACPLGPAALEVRRVLVHLLLRPDHLHHAQVQLRPQAEVLVLRRAQLALRLAQRTLVLVVVLQEHLRRRTRLRQRRCVAAGRVDVALLAAVGRTRPSAHRLAHRVRLLGRHREAWQRRARLQQQPRQLPSQLVVKRLPRRRQRRLLHQRRRLRHAVRRQRRRRRDRDLRPVVGPEVLQHRGVHRVQGRAACGRGSRRGAGCRGRRVGGLLVRSLGARGGGACGGGVRVVVVGVAAGGAVEVDGAFEAGRRVLRVAGSEGAEGVCRHRLLRH
eukprot:Rhum_TRINITY_DN12270_c0_g1::Rhum_TRINITY_DN12270_c0_g1_i1::g.50597::m.50597